MKTATHKINFYARLMPRDRRVSTGGKGTKGDPSPPSFWSLTALRHTMARVVGLRGTFLIPSSLRRSNPPLLTRFYPSVSH